ncbi:MAG: hypothetical protein KDA41_12365, partial [Planctomycetales bacterium]|nr:hypothetical protein [Planctomycetales bacterium]
IMGQNDSEESLVDGSGVATDTGATPSLPRPTGVGSGRPAPPPRPRPRPAPVPEPDPETPPAIPTPTPEPPVAVPTPTPSPVPTPIPTPTPEPEPPVAVPAPTPTPIPQPAPPDPTTIPVPVPIPSPSPEPTPPAPTPPKPQDVAALKAAMEGVRTALGERDFDAALTQLKTAESLVRTDEQKQKLERLKQLDHYVNEFWRSVDQAYVFLRATQTLTTRSGEISVVDVGPEAIIVRSAGRNVTFPRDKIPSGLAMAIANGWFNDDPANDLVRGALQLVDPQGRPEEARRLWQQARGAGVAEAATLLPLIDEKYDF